MNRKESAVYEIVRAQPGQFGLEISAEAKRRHAVDPKFPEVPLGNVYVVLRKLERQGWLQSEQRDRDGQQRFCYHVTGKRRPVPESTSPATGFGGLLDGGAEPQPA